MFTRKCTCTSKYWLHLQLHGVSNRGYFVFDFIFEDPHKVNVWSKFSHVLCIDHGPSFDNIVTTFRFPLDECQTTCRNSRNRQTEIITGMVRIMKQEAVLQPRGNYSGNVDTCWDHQCLLFKHCPIFSEISRRTFRAYVCLTTIIC